MRTGLWRNVAVATSSALVAALLLSGGAHAITDTVFRYSTARTGYISLPPAAFVPLSDTYQYDKNTGIVGSSTAGKACFSAPVILPTGVVMETLGIWYQKFNDPTFHVELLRNTFDNSTNESLVAATPADTAGLPKSANFNITGTTSVNNRDDNYQLIVCMTGTLNWIANARIKFSYRTAGY